MYARRLPSGEKASAGSSSEGAIPRSGSETAVPPGGATHVRPLEAIGLRFAAALKHRRRHNLAVGARKHGARRGHKSHGNDQGS